MPVISNENESGHNYHDDELRLKFLRELEQVPSDMKVLSEVCTVNVVTVKFSGNY